MNLQLSSLLCLLALLLRCEAAAETDYVRYVADTVPQKLQTGVLTLKHTSGATVDLVGAVHVADAAYYQQLNESFRHYDAVLYELVGGPMPKTKTAAARDKGSLSWVGDLHHTMQQALGLSSQLQCIDYRGAQFVHADVSVEEFQRLKEQKSESFLGLFLKAYQTQQELMANGKSAGTMTLPQALSLLSGSGSRVEAKRALAQQFHEVERLMMGVEGDKGTVIIGERNKKALSVLEQQLKLQRRKLAIFYGAAHLPDLETRLKATGWQIVGSPRYLDAWLIAE